MKKILITNPIYYPNAKPHIGTAHTMILSDFLKRAFETINYDVFLSLGTDEHSEKVSKRAEELNLKPQDYVDQIAQVFKEATKSLKINYNKFIRTSDEDHKEAVVSFWKHMKNKGLIYKGKYEGYYSSADETFYLESSLVNGKAPSGAEVYKETIDAYFFKSSLFQEQLLKYYENNPKLTTPNNRINELKGFIKDKFMDLCISRKKGWGISVPDDNDFTVYVWFDALINYLTISNYPKLNEYWEGRTIHIIGKDISVFHGVHWPSMLLAHENIKMFDDLLIHNWWLLDNDKMSKSKQNIIDPMEIIEKYGVDALRFYCLKNNLVKSDENFSSEDMKNTFNTFCVDKFSNLIYRTWNIIDKNSIAIDKARSNSFFEDQLKQLIEKLDINSYIDILFQWIDDLNFRVSQEKIWENHQCAKVIFEEILQMINYFDPITPGVKSKISLNSTPIKIFEKL